MKKVYSGKAVSDNREINAVITVLKNDSLSLFYGNNVTLLETKFSSIFVKKYCLLVNSGSSAHLLAIPSVNLSKISEILTPTLTF